VGYTRVTLEQPFDPEALPGIEIVSDAEAVVCGDPMWTGLSLLEAYELAHELLALVRQALPGLFFEQERPS
jgi:hypothetical protein